jgi:hypothetical protein
MSVLDHKNTSIFLVLSCATCLLFCQKSTASHPRDVSRSFDNGIQAEPQKSINRLRKEDQTDSTTLSNTLALSQSHPFYVGLVGGYGSTTWQGLVPPSEKQNLAMSLSTPTDVTEGGGVWGIFSGFEWTPYFATEVGYLRYQNAQVVFNSDSLFSFLHDGQTQFTTHTETIHGIGKIMLIIPKTTMRAFSSVGAAVMHRNDLLYDGWRITPTFGIGLNYNISKHIMSELGANYTAGYGEAQLNPTEVYFPFLYSVTLRLAYRF